MADELAGGGRAGDGQVERHPGRRRPRRRPDVAARGVGAAARSCRPPARRTCSADAGVALRRFAVRAEPVEHWRRCRRSRVGPRLPAEVDRGPARVERTSGASSPGAGGGVHAPASSTPAAAAIVRVELVDRRLGAGADVAQQPAALVGGPDERVDDVVDEDEVARLRRRRRRSCTGSRPARRPAKMATTPASPCGSWRGP